MSDLPAPPPGLEADLLAPGLIHEMRHPLTGLKAGLQLIAKALGERVTTLDEWDLVASQVRRLEDTLQTFQELTDPRPGGLFPFAVEPVVKDALALLRLRTRRLGGRFALVVEGPMPPALGSSRALLHAVTNLVVNALEAVEETGRAGRVEVRLLRDPATRQPQVRVADEGAGLSPEAAARLFEPRFTTKPPGKGNGLGLSIARRLLGASRGELRLVAPGEPGRRPWAAAEFTIDLAAAGEGP